MQSIKTWLASNPRTINIALICLAAVLIVALLVGVDLSWIPPILFRLVGLG